MRTLRWQLALVLTAVACGTRGGEPEGEAGAAPDDSMASMNMDSTPSDSVSVTFTPGQVRHGGVRWAAATSSPGATGLSAVATVPGQMTPNEDRTARLGAPARGRILSVRVSPGVRVRAGQVLVTLQSPEAGTAQSELAKATAVLASERAELVYASSARDRAERLLALKAIPRQDYERAIADHELALAEVAQAEAELRRAQSTARDLGATSGASGEIALRAPLAGVVLERTAVPGTVVEAGAPLVVVTDISSLWLTMDAPEGLAGHLRVGADLQFVVPAFPADTFRARLSVVGSGLDPETRTLAARAVVPNPGNRLKPAMLATVLLSSAPGAPGRSAGTVVLPAGAIQLVNGRPSVFLAMPDDKGGARFIARAVEIGSGTGSVVAVTRGVSPGELVVIEGASAVKTELRRAASPRMEM
jgi:RND family efflux transporter MFP subunit